MSKARWQDGKLVINSSQKVRNRTIETLTTLSLSQDGKSLTMLKEMKNPRRRLREKSIFRKIK